MQQTAKKLALVLVTSMLVTDTSSKVIVRILYIYYPVLFQKDQRQEDQKQITLFNSGNKVNAISPAFARKLGLHIRKLNIRAYKIESYALETFKIVIIDLEMEDKADRSRFF